MNNKSVEKNNTGCGTSVKVYVKSSDERKESNPANLCFYHLEEIFHFICLIPL
jgi:hypothetical protein